MIKVLATSKKWLIAASVVLFAALMFIAHNYFNRIDSGMVAEPSGSLQVTEQPTSELSTYLNIKELGIKIKLSDDIKDAVYYVASPSNSWAEVTVRVSTQSLIDETDGDCDRSLGALQKITNLNHPRGFTLEVNNEDVFEFDGYYIFYSSPNTPCGPDDETVSLELAQLVSFKKALQTMQRN